jgi:putative ABC transport system permease protein
VTMAQFALSLVLVVSALLFARTMINLRDADLGFDARDVLTMSLEPEGMDPVSPGPPRGERMAFWADVLDRVRALPGVRHASLSILTPLSGRDTARQVSVPGYTPARPRDALIRVNHVSEGYVETLGLELRAGRALAAADANGPRVAVVNEAAVRHFFDGRNALGEPLTFGAAGTWHVVGVIADHRHANVRDPAPPLALVSNWQPMDRLTRITLSVRADASPTLARDIGDQVRSAYPRTLVSDVLDAQAQVDATLVSERVVASLSMVLATVTLVLAAVGLYGGLSHGVAYRRVELGVRLALGAAPRQLAWSLYRSVLTAIACGAAVGLPLAWWLMARARPLLFGVDTGDLSAYAASLALLATAGMLAAWGPARRARRIAPAEALRHG